MQSETNNSLIIVTSLLAIRSNGSIVLGHPGVACELFGSFRGTDRVEATDSFARYSVQIIEVSSLKEQAFADLLTIIAGKMGFVHDIDGYLACVSPCLICDSGIVYIDNTQLRVQTVMKSLSIVDQAYLLLVFNGDAGAVFAGEDPGYRYCFHSRESGKHNIPHIHVDYRHEEFGSFSLYDGLMLDGNMRASRRRFVANKIADNRALLLNEWNRLTDGMRADLDFAIGSCEVK